MPNYQTTPIELTFGTDAGADPKISKGLLKTENGIWDREGAIEKRVGFGRGESGAAGGQLYLGEVDGRLFAVSPGYRSQDYPATTMTTVDSTTQVIRASVERYSAVTNAFPYFADYAYLGSGNRHFVAWASNNAHKVTQRDDDNGACATVSEPDASMLAYDDYRTRVVRVSDSLVYWVWCDVATQRIKFCSFDGAGTRSATTTITGFSAFYLGDFDCAVTMKSPSSHVLSIIARDTSSPGVMRIVQVLDGVTIAYGGASTAANEVTTAVCVAPFGDGTTFFGWATWDIFTYALKAYGRVVDSSAVTVVSQAMLISSASSYDTVRLMTATPATAGNSINVYVCQGIWDAGVTGWVYPRVTQHVYSNSGGVGSASAGASVYGMAQASKPFKIGDNECMWMFARQWNNKTYNWGGASPSATVPPASMQYASLQTAYLAYSWTTGKVLAQVSAGKADASNWAITERGYSFAAGVHVASGVVRTVLPEQPNQQDTTGAHDHNVLNLVTLSLSHELGPSVLQFGDYATVGSSAPLVAFRGYPRPHGFFQYPEKLSHNTNGAGTGFVAGTYYFRAIYETTEDGVIMRSAPTPVPLRVTLSGAAANIQIWVPSIGVDGGKAIVYRTVANGTEYYRAAEAALSPLASHVSVTCAISDALLVSREMLYTETGEQPDDPAPPYWVSCVHQNRMVVVDMYAPRVHYSKKIAPGRVPSFALGANYVDMPTAASDITALISLGDKLLICTAAKIYATEGEGYDNAGGGVNYREPFIVSHSVGCESHKGIVWAHDAVLFKSQDIIYRIDAGLNLSPVGEPVRYYTDTYAVRGTSQNASKHSVIFHTDGPALCYDWLRDRWATFPGWGCTDAIGIGDRSYWLGASRSGYYDIYATRSTAVYKDVVLSTNNPTPTEADYWLPMKIDTGWVKLAEHARYPKIQFIGQNLSAHTLRVRIAYNYDPNWTDDLSLSSAATTAFSHTSYMGTGLSSSYKDQAYIPEISLSRQLAQAIRIEISDEYRTGSTDSAAWTLSKIVIVSRPKADLMRRSSARRF